MSVAIRTDRAVDVSKTVSRWREWWVAIAACLMLTLAATVMFIVAVFTGFRMRRLYAECLARRLGQAVLAICGIQLEVHNSTALKAFREERQVVYVANHTSTLDVFILLSLGLPRTRFFLSGKYRVIPPLAIIGYLVGVFFTTPQSDRPGRIRCFQNAERVLRRTGDSVFLSPEGTRVTSGEIGPFNKGAFHLVTNLKVPLVPIFIAIPRHINPGRGWAARSGTVHVYLSSPISTDGWELRDLDRNRARVRDLYVEMNSRWRLE